MQPILDRIPELDGIISQKICTEFPIILYNLQQQIIDIAFNEDDYEGVAVVQRSYNNYPVYNRLLLQINLLTTKLTPEQILNFYHHGMIDYLEFRLNPSTEALLDKFGEKFIITAGNIASYSDSPTIGCKIFSSFPEADSYTYRPARKRVFISHRIGEQKYLRKLACSTDLCFDHMKEFNTNRDTTEQWVLQGQETPKLPVSFKWNDYKLLAEGHYIQIWSHYNWDMYLPFIGESHICPIDINNREYPDPDQEETASSPVSIESTHRDF